MKCESSVASKHDGRFSDWCRYSVIYLMCGPVQLGKCTRLANTWQVQVGCKGVTANGSWLQGVTASTSNAIIGTQSSSGKQSSSSMCVCERDHAAVGVAGLCALAAAHAQLCACARNAFSSCILKHDFWLCCVVIIRHKRVSAI